MTPGVADRWNNSVIPVAVRSSVTGMYVEVAVLADEAELIIAARVVPLVVQRRLHRYAVLDVAGVVRFARFPMGVAHLTRQPSVAVGELISHRTNLPREAGRVRAKPG